MMTIPADSRATPRSRSENSVATHAAAAVLSNAPEAGQFELSNLPPGLSLIPDTDPSPTAPQAPPPSTREPWQTLSAAELSQPWADMAETSDEEGLDPPRQRSGSSMRRGSISLLSAQLGSVHLSVVGSIDSPSLPGRSGLHRNSSISQPVRTQMGFNLAPGGESTDLSSPGTGEARIQPPALRAVPSALRIQSKDGPAVMSCEPHLEAVRGTRDDRAAAAMLSRAAAGLKAGRVPEVPREGMGGTYFVSDPSGTKVGIFKPCDEEPMAPNNPKGWSGRAMGDPGMKPGVRVGEAALREVAAYLIDHEGFAGVPPACLVSMRHSALSYGAVSGDTSDTGAACVGSLGSDGLPDFFSAAPDQRLMAPVPPGGLKLGSLQAFAAHESDANDVAPSRYCSASVHRIGVLDLRLLNLDRHAGNLLVLDVSRSCARLGIESTAGPALHALVPIDHGYALPEALHNPYFEWQYWPQASVPFSDEVKAYVARLDGAADAAMLARRLPELRPESLRCLMVTTMVLKKGVAAGLTLFEMAAMMTRPMDSAPSDFEALCMDAREAALQSGALVSSGLSAPLFSQFDGDAAQSGSLAMSGLGDSLGICSDSSPQRLPAAGGDGDDGASSESPCMAASEPRAVEPSWLCTAPLASSGTDTSEWGAAAFAGLRSEAETPVAGGSAGDGEEFASHELCMPPALMSAPSEARPGRSGGLRRTVWEGRRQGAQTSVYPPLLEAVHPDKANYVFSGLSEAQWNVFMSRLACDLDEELAQGTWKARRHNAPVAASCPNPVKNHRF